MRIGQRTRRRVATFLLVSMERAIRKRIGDLSNQRLSYALPKRASVQPFFPSFTGTTTAQSDSDCPLPSFSSGCLRTTFEETMGKSEALSWDKIAAFTRTKPVNGVVSVTFGDARFKVLCFNDDGFALSYAVAGSFIEAKTFECWLRIAADASTIVDVGAYTGWFSLGAQSVNKNATIHSFEPVPHIFSRMVTNFKLNGLETSSPLVAISDEDAVRDLSTKRNTAYLSTASSLEFQQLRQNFVAIPTITRKLDTLLKHEKVDLLKVDVEGAEIRCLRGAEATLRRSHPVIFLEMWQNNKGKISEFLTNLGYELQYVESAPAPNWIAVHPDGLLSPLARTIFGKVLR